MRARLKRSETDPSMIELTTETGDGTRYLWCVIPDCIIEPTFSQGEGDVEIAHEIEQNGFADIEIRLAR